METRRRRQRPSSPKASDALPLPLPLSLTNTVFFTLFFSLTYFLLQRWRHKAQHSLPLHVLTFSDLAAILTLLASFIYLLGFFGIDFVQSFTARGGTTEGCWEGVDEDEEVFAVNENDPRRFYVKEADPRRVGGGRNVSLLDHEGFGERAVKGGGIECLLNLEGVLNRVLKGGEIESLSNLKGVNRAVKAGGIECLLNLENVLNRVLKGREIESSLNLEGVNRVVKGGETESLLNLEGVNNVVKGGGIDSFVNLEGVKRVVKGEGIECLLSEEDEEVVKGVVSGEIASYSLESRIGDCEKAALIRRVAVERLSGRSLEGLPIQGFDYGSILGQCCEMPVGYVQIPVGVVGPLLLNGCEYMVPLATTEGCLVASTNKGCKAIYASGGATCVLTKDEMTRAPVVRFGTAKRATDLKFFLEDPLNFGTLAVVFNKSSRFGKLQRIKCSIAGRNLYIRFGCFTGDAMGMNMVSKGVQNVLEFLRSGFPDMDVIGISGNFCSDKKPAAVNWIEGRGKSVVCEAVIPEEVLQKVLKTSVHSLVELNMLKNLTGSALAGSVGGFNAHAANIVSAIFIATGQDPAQNIESSSCITMMEAVNDGKDLHVSVTMPCIEVGTIGGGTQLASQSACLNLLGVKGANKESPGANSSLLATIIAGSVLAGELNLMSAIAEGQLVKSHMKYNRAART